MSDALQDQARDTLAASAREEWLTVKEFAPAYNVRENTLLTWIRDGRVTGEFRDGQWWVKLASNGRTILECPVRQFHHQGVYFIECAEFIKIGFAEDVIKRFKFINGASPFPCKAIGFVPTQDRDSAKALERHWHQRFAPLHERHEWFRGVPRLRDAITLEARPWPTRNTKKRQ